MYVYYLKGKKFKIYTQDQSLRYKLTLNLC